MKLVRKPSLIPEWKQAWKYLSVQLAVVLGMIEVLSEQMPFIQQYLPEGWVKYFAIAIVAGRILSQNAPTAKDEESPK